MRDLDPGIPLLIRRPAARRCLAACLGLLSGLSGSAAFAVAMPGPATVASAPEPELLDRVIALLSEPGVRGRSSAAARLGALSDARAVEALAYVARHDRSRDVASAAVRALGGSGRPEVPGVLARLGRDAERRGVAELALETLGERRSDEAFAALMALARDHSVSLELRKHAISMARRYFPARRDELPRLAGSAAVAAAGGAGFGAYTMGMIGRFSATESAESIGWATGAVLGGVGGFLVGRELPVERQMYYASGLFWGAAVGSLLGSATHKAPVKPEYRPYFPWTPADREARDRAQTRYDEDLAVHDRYVGGLSVAGEMLAGLGAWAVADRLDLSAGDVVVADLGASAAFLITFGLLEQGVPREDGRGDAAWLAAGTVGGLGLATWVAPRLRFSPGDTSLAALGVGEGAVFGLSITSLVLTDRSSRPGSKMGGGMAIGAGLGLVAGGALAQVTAYDTGEVSQMLVFSVLGKAVGAGAVMLGDPKDTDPTLVGMMVGGAAGLVGAATAGRSLRYEGGDVPLVTIATGWGLWHGFALSSYLDRHMSLSGTQLGGATLLSGGVFGAGAVVASQMWDFSGLEATMGSVGLGWGAWLAGWSGALADWKAEDVVFATAIGGDVGAAASALLVSPAVGLDPLVVGGASLGGVGLAGVSTMAAMMFTSNRDRWIQANLAGSVVGLLGGGLITARLVRGRARRAFGSTPGPSLSWLRGLTAAPLLDREGRLNGAALTLQGTL